MAAWKTITDLNTGLMWEKKTQLDGMPFEKYGHAMSQCRCAVLADEHNSIGVQDTGQIPPSQTFSNLRS